MTLKVMGTNFPTQAAILWNGAPLATTSVDANTLSGTIGSSNIANPATVQLQVQNTQTMQASPAVSLVIAPPSADGSSPLTISATSLPQATVNSLYTGTLSATGGTSPYTWSITTGQLPQGLSLAANTGIISGTPVSAGNYSFGVTINDSGSSAQSATATVSLVVAAAASTATPLTINSSTLSAGTIGSGYTHNLQATGGTAPYTWSITSGALPGGLTLSAATGIIAGTPTATGTFNFTARVADAGNPAQTISASLSIVIAPVTLAITSTALPAGTQGTSYSRALQAVGGASPYTWAISSGSLPTGLTLSPSTGVISGTPTVSGNFSFGVTVSDAGSPLQTGTSTVTLSLVAAGAPLAISSTSLPGGTSNQPYLATLNATGGTAPYAWALTSGSLPSGLSLAATTGIITGKPAASGTTSLTFKVVDSSSPAQNQSVTLSLVVAPVPLALTTSTLPSGTKATPYSSTLQASGGTTPYSWSITGSLPPGLTLAASTGLISGTPTASGTSNITATVTDAASPKQTKSLALSLVIAAAAAPTLTINATLPAGTAGTAYSSAMTATGGTPPYTWSMSGSLPSGLTLAATSGVISGTPAVSGPYNFTATVSDNGTPVQTKSAATSISLASQTTASGPGTTWYIRPDGGSRYSANQPLGQCDGKADVAYSGSGTNQHCAFNDYRYLYDDKSYGNSAWVIAGGDTVIIRGGPWRVGFNQGTSSNDVWCYGGSGNNACTNPTIPAGTPTQHTRILGENYASCSAGNTTNKSMLTEIFGGFGVGTPMNLAGAQYVDVQCLNITRHSQCVVHGSPQYPSGCNTGLPTDDYDSVGIVTDVHTHDLLMQDIWDHGHTDRGVKGPIGGTVTCNRCDIAYNGMAGWDFDDGSGSNNGNGTASLPGSIWNFNYSTIEWSGCNQEYPATHTIPVISCYSQSSGGYGDGVGTPPGMCLTANINHSAFNYNTQDGFDLGHIDTGSCSVTINASQAIGNSGQTFKWGPNENPAVFTNNFTLANCLRLSESIPGTPSTFNASLADFCRAGSNLSFNFRQGGTALLANNTIVGYQPTTYDMQCWDASCSNSALTFKNNITLGYDNPATYSYGGQVGGLGGLYFEQTIGTVTRSNNIWYGMRATSFSCPTGFPGEYCGDPLFVNEPTGQGPNFVSTELDNFNFAPSAGSPAMGAGSVISGVPNLLLDYNGVTRPNPPSIGAQD